MIYEFEGRTEKEAIDKAASELGMEKDQFDVEILETQRSGLFKKGFVKIQVHTDQSVTGKPENFSNDMRSSSMAAEYGRNENVPAGKAASQTGTGTGRKKNTGQSSADDFEAVIAGFVETLIERMGYPGKVSILYREESKIGLKIESEYSSILIGKKGKNLDALQLLVNIFAGRQGREDMRIILDTENYRLRREESLVRLAYTVADKVRETRNSILLEPMNPFDRRLIHTTLNDISDVETKSEGEGLYKQVRVYFRGYR